MTNRTRNFAILGIVLVLLAASAVVIATKPTKLGLDLRGGTELVYQGRPTPQVPTVTPQAVDDAIDTIRKRTNSLGVTETEIQRSGRDQISVGLPDVQNAQRAIAQVGTTAQLQFYDWEPNVLGRGPDSPYAGTKALYQATEQASKEKPKAEATDVPPGSDMTPAEADAANDSTSTPRFYLFGPDQLPIGPDGQPLRTGDYDPGSSCEEVLSDFDSEPGKPPEYAKGTACLEELNALGSGGPPAGSRVIEVPKGIVVVEGERVPNQPPQIKRFFVIEDDTELSGTDIKNPKAATDQNSQPVVTMEFTDKGREAFARVTKRIAERGSKIIPPAGTPREQTFQRFAITLDNSIVSLATIDYVSNPEGIDGRTGAQIENIGSFQETNDLAESLRIGALPIELKLISNTQVSATLGQQALDQGLLAGGVGLALTILFLLLFYRVLGLVATAALLIYAVLLFALVKLIPITLTLPGIAGMVLTLAVAADANIVMYERIKEEVRAGRSIPAAISTGYSKALRTIIDANVVTIGVAFILFTLATAGIKGFAFTLGVGTLVSLFTAVLATSAILGTMARSRVLRRPSALGVGKESTSGWRFDFMGKSRWFFSFSGVILAVGRDRDRLARAQLRHRLRVGHTDHDAAREARERPGRPGHARSAGLRRREDPGGRGPGARQQRDPGRGSAARARRGGQGRAGARRGLRRPERRLLCHLHRADLRGADRPDGDHRRDRVAAPDLDLHRGPVRVQVRRAGADRAGARPPHHSGRVRPVRPGGDDVDGRGAAHDLWATRSTTPSSCSTESARTCRACRAPPSPRSRTARCPRCSPDRWPPASWCSCRSGRCCSSAATR